MVPFDNRDGWIWVNGALIPWRDAQVHILTHALHYGSSVFEGERVYGGKVFKLTAHSQRLVDSGRVLGFDVPYSTAEIDAATIEVVKANNVQDGYVRPIAWRGAEQMGVSAPKTRIHVAIATWDWPHYFSPEIQQHGLKLTMSRWARPAPNTAPTAAKASGLYMICTIAKHEAEAAGFHDSLMLDYRGRLAEATGANLFLVIDGALHTPIPDCFLDGITRRTVMDLARQRGIEVVERAIWPAELEQAQELFLTGTAAEIAPIGQIDDLRFKVGPITSLLRADYQELVRA